jgi:hypothetical protein
MLYSAHRQKRVFMKNLVILAVSLFSLNALAQDTTPAKTKSPIVISVVDDCGYCSNHDYEAKTCDISEDGTVLIVDHKIKKEERRSTHSVTAATITHFKKLIESARTAKTAGTIQTGSGDLPSFSVSAYPEAENMLEIETYSYGHEYLDSVDATTLARQSAKICGMNTKRLLWKYVLSKVKP